MRGRHSIYAFIGILGVHISGDVVENQMLQIIVVRGPMSTEECRYIVVHSVRKHSVILSVSEESGAGSRHRAPSGTPDPSLTLRMTMDAQDDNGRSG